MLIEYRKLKLRKWMDELYEINSINKKKFIYTQKMKKNKITSRLVKDELTDFNGISTCLGLLYN